MGNCCIKSKDKKDNEEQLIRYMFCEKCHESFISNYEYNKHIYECNQRYKIDKSF